MERKERMKLIRQTPLSAIELQCSGRPSMTSRVFCSLNSTMCISNLDKLNFDQGEVQILDTHGTLSHIFTHQ